MEVTQAVQAAKNYVLEIFGEEGIVNVGLEEVQSKGRSNCSPGGSTGYSLSWLRQSTAFPCRAMVVATSGL